MVQIARFGRIPQCGGSLWCGSAGPGVVPIAHKPDEWHKLAHHKKSGAQQWITADQPARTSANIFARTSSESDSHWSINSARSASDTSNRASTAPHSAPPLVAITLFPGVSEESSTPLGGTISYGLFPRRNWPEVEFAFVHVNAVE